MDAGIEKYRDAILDGIDSISYLMDGGSRKALRSAFLAGNYEYDPPKTEDNLYGLTGNGREETIGNILHHWGNSVGRISDAFESAEEDKEREELLNVIKHIQTAKDHTIPAIDQFLADEAPHSSNPGKMQEVAENIKGRIVRLQNLAAGLEKTINTLYPDSNQGAQR